jgi:hypothetical protein
MESLEVEEAIDILERVLRKFCRVDRAGIYGTEKDQSRYLQ